MALPQDSDNDSDMEPSNKSNKKFTLKSSNAPPKFNSSEWPLLLKVCSTTTHYNFITHINIIQYFYPQIIVFFFFIFLFFIFLN